MHVLTKIFIVLVSLLTVLLVPLVVVYAYNENSFQARYQQAEDQAAAARSTLEVVKATASAEALRRETQNTELSKDNSELLKQISSQQVDLLGIESELSEAKLMDSEIRARLATLTSSVDAGQQLTESLIEELRSLRREALASERQKVELDERLRDVSAQLDAAVEARRALQEELQRVRDDHARTLETVAEYVARHGEIQIAAGERGLGTRPIDRDLDANVISVRRNADAVYAEIDAGSRDGVKEGWLMTIGSDGAFVARLRIISVDINRATGIVELEDEFSRGRVDVGDRVYARVGR